MKWKKRDRKFNKYHNTIKEGLNGVVAITVIG